MFAGKIAMIQSLQMLKMHLMALGLPKTTDELISYGINCMTSGNHIWDKKDIYTYI